MGLSRNTASLIATTLLTFVMSLSAPNSAVFAQQPAQNSDASVKSGQPEAAAKAQTPPKPTLPSDEKLVMLICSTLIALNHANATGNYSVFREMAAPGFQFANSTAQLSETFAELRNRNFDLSPIVLLQPKLARRPEVSANGVLRVAGFFPTRPEQINFDLIFQFVKGQWRMFGIAANTVPVQPNAAVAASQPKQADAAPVAADAAPVAGDQKSPAKQAKASLPDVRDKIQSIEESPASPAKSATSDVVTPFR